jgi:hypothetical protein
VTGRVPRWIEFWTDIAAAGDRFLEVRTDATESTTIPVSHAPSWLQSYLEWAGSLLRRGGWGDDKAEEVVEVLGALAGVCYKKSGVFVK